MDDQSTSARVEATSAVLHAASHSLFHACRPTFDLYMHCRRTTLTPSPSLCAPLAQSVIDCANRHFLWLSGSPCQKAFRQFWRCLDNNDQNVIYCRGEESGFLECVRGEKGEEVRRLWRGSGPEEGKVEAKGAEEGRWPFQWHVWWHKNHKPNDE